jgi:hypothetical protein
LKQIFIFSFLTLHQKYAFVLFLSDSEIPFFDHIFKVKHFAPKRKPKIKSNCTESQWNDVGGMEEIKKALEEMISFPHANPQLFTEFCQREAGFCCMVHQELERHSLREHQLHILVLFSFLSKDLSF